MNLIGERRRLGGLFLRWGKFLLASGILSISRAPSHRLPDPKISVLIACRRRVIYAPLTTFHQLHRPNGSILQTLHLESIRWVLVSRDSMSLAQVAPVGHKRRADCHRGDGSRRSESVADTFVVHLPSLELHIGGQVPQSVDRVADFVNHLSQVSTSTFYCSASKQDAKDETV